MFVAPSHFDESFQDYQKSSVRINTDSSSISTNAQARAPRVVARLAKLLIRFLAVCVTVAAMLSFSQADSIADESGIAVIYPDLNDYNAIFESIAEGVSTNVSGPVYRIALSENTAPTELQSRLAASSVKGIIALGRRGIEVAKTLDWKGPLVVGAVIGDPSTESNRVPGISLDPDPISFFNYLRLLAPNIRRIYTVINPEQSNWLMERARAAAANHGLMLVVRQAANRRASAFAYRDILNHLDPQRDGLWLPLDPNLDEATLQLVLATAWSKRIVIFSSTPDHAQRGALFSVYPNYPALGRRLADILRQQMAGETVQRGMRPISDLRLAVNLRTAHHLGFEYDDAVKARIEIVFK
ncbi:MAG: ABC transporter substrate binding protein [Sulfuricaulis sp.]